MDIRRLVSEPTRNSLGDFIVIGGGLEGHDSPRKSIGMISFLPPH